MDNWFNSRWFVRGVSLAFAVLLFVFVNIEINKYPANTPRVPDGSDEIDAIDNVPVGIRIDEDKYVVSGVPEFVTVSLEGSKGTLTPIIRQRSFNVFVDLEGLDVGEHTVEIVYANIPNEVKVYIEPKTIDITIEEKASKEFPVNVDFINTDQLPVGYELGESQVNPKTVNIISSKSIIEQIAIVKVFVDVGGITESINNREVPVNVYDNQGNELSVRVEPENAVVSVEVDNPSKKVPVNVSTTGELPEGFTLVSITANKDEVELFGTSESLADITEITTEEIDLSDITETNTIDTKLLLPKGTQTKGADKVEINIQIGQVKAMEDVPIDVKNLDDGRDFSFIQPEDPVMSITIDGNEKDVRDLTVEDFQVFVDVEGLNMGEHTVPIAIESPENVTVQAEFEEVRIEIT